MLRKLVWILRKRIEEGSVLLFRIWCVCCWISRSYCLINRFRRVDIVKCLKLFSGESMVLGLGVKLQIHFSCWKLHLILDSCTASTGAQRTVLCALMIARASFTPHRLFRRTSPHASGVGRRAPSYIGSYSFLGSWLSLSRRNSRHWASRLCATVILELSSRPRITTGLSPMGW